jgi:hypothetical protein
LQIYERLVEVSVTTLEKGTLENLAANLVIIEQDTNTVIAVITECLSRLTVTIQRVDSSLYEAIKIIDRASSERA